MNFDWKLWGKVASGIASAVIMALVGTHNMDATTASTVTGLLAAVLGFLTANDHNTGPNAS